MTLKIALLGKLPKGDHARESWIDWKSEYIEKIQRAIPDAQILHGDQIRDDKGSELVVGHDLWIVKHADLVVVDAREKIGAGTAQEMVMAKYFKRPLISVIPKNTHHRKSNLTFNGKTLEDWIHPFLDVSSDYVASDIDDAIVWLQKYTLGKIGNPIKDISVFEKAIAAFETQLPNMAEQYRQAD